jgi:acid phosphatase type 7
MPRMTHASWFWLTPLFLSTLAVSGPLAVGHDGPDHEHAPKQVKPAEYYAPTAVPDRIILTWAGDPSTTQAVTWRTSGEVQDAVAQIAIADGGPNFQKAVETVKATSQDLTTDINEARFHTVKFESLTPNTKYVYRVGDGVEREGTDLNWSEWFHFTTASDKPEPFSFIYFGDAQNDIRSMWSRVIREAYSDAPKAKFMIHAGDLINNAETDSQWGEWFEAGHWLNAMMPSVPVPGNHEQAKAEDGTRRLSHHWRPQFALPEEGPAGLEEACYTLVYQGVRIIGMESNRKVEEQREWLDKVLTDNKCSWVVCTFHHPIFSTGKERDNKALREMWKPVLDKHHVDIVLQGHDHTYGRTGLETPIVELETVANVATGINKRDLETGTVYVVSVSGPKQYDLQKHEFMKRQAQDTQLYQIIHIDGDKLKYEARTATGEVYDAFTLVKQPGKINKLIEQIPETPERLRKPSTEQAAK